MNKLLFLLPLMFIGCNSGVNKPERNAFTEVEVETLYEDSINIRAIEIIENNLVFAGNNGQYGIYNASEEKVSLHQQQHDSLLPEFRAVAGSSSNFFMLSVANPALLYKQGEAGKMELVYQEENEKVFYDSMIFWNEKEGIAMGDPVENCLSIIITRDAGENWNKLSCEEFPEAKEGEAGFAASNSNIAVKGDHTWIISGGLVSRVYYSPDKGKNWKVYNTPLVDGKSTTGAYSVHFYDEDNGVIIGGDYTAPEDNTANKARTSDGGETWQLIAEGKDPGYKSSIRYVPNGDAKEMVAVGFTGISYSSDAGESWKNLSEEGFYTIRFLNDSIAYAAGKGRLARLRFK